MVETDASRRSYRNVSWLIALFIIAFAFRLAVVSRMAMPPANDLLWNDAVGWNLANGRGFTATLGEPKVPGVFRTPGYPTFLAVVYSLAGHSHWAAYLAQALIDSLTGIFVWLIAMKLLGAGVAYASGLIYGLNPYSTIHCGILSQDILLTFTVVLALYLIILAGYGSGKTSLWFAAGVTIGLAALVKAFIVLYVIVALLIQCFVLRSAKKFVTAAAFTGLGIGLVVTPWVVRNYLCFHRFPPLAVGGTGTNLTYLVEELREGESALVGKQEVATGDRLSSAVYLNNFVDGAELIEKEYRLAQGAKVEIQRRWPAYLLLVVKHIPRLWITKYTLGQGGAARLAASAVSIVTLITGLAGMLLLRNRWGALLPLYLTVIVITLIYAPYTAEARYTLPARPAMIIFIGALVATAVKRFWPPRACGW